jgi:hypothetical protein
MQPWGSAPAYQALYTQWSCCTGHATDRWVHLVAWHAVVGFCTSLPSSIYTVKLLHRTRHWQMRSSRSFACSRGVLYERSFRTWWTQSHTPFAYHMNIINWSYLIRYFFKRHALILYYTFTLPVPQEPTVKKNYILLHVWFWELWKEIIFTWLILIVFWVLTLLYYWCSVDKNAKGMSYIYLWPECVNSFAVRNTRRFGMPTAVQAGGSFDEW